MRIEDLTILSIYSFMNSELRISCHLYIKLCVISCVLFRHELGIKNSDLSNCPVVASVIRPQSEGISNCGQRAQLMHLKLWDNDNEI